MLKHADIWRAIDSLASQHGLTASGLARKAGLDPTTFNKSKRVTSSGRCRWPSTESVAKALEAVDATLDEFVGFVQVNGNGFGPRQIPVAAQSRVALEGAFGDTGEPKGGAWDRIQFPDICDPDAYAIVVECDCHGPILRDGARVVAAPNAGLRPGNRVVVRLTSAEIILAELIERNDDRIEIMSLCGDAVAQTFMSDQVAALHRIVWVEQ